MTTAPEILRDRQGRKPDLALQFYIDHAKRLVGFEKHGKRVNPEELRQAKKLLQLAREAGQC